MLSFRSEHPGRTFGWPDLTRSVDLYLATGHDLQRATSGDYQPAIDMRGDYVTSGVLSDPTALTTSHDDR